MSKINRFLGYNPDELEYLTNQIEENTKEPRRSILKEIAQTGVPITKESKFAKLYVGKELPTLTEEIILNSLNELKKLPEVLFTCRLIKEIPNILATLAYIANKKAENDVKLLSELLPGVSKELFFGVKLDTSDSQSSELLHRIHELKNEVEKFKI